MIALLVLYALAVGTACAAAAWLAERAALVTGRPARWAWVTALVLTVALPALAGVAAARDRDAAERVDPSLVFGAATAVARPNAKAPAPASAPRPQAPVVRAPDAWARLDRPLAAAWLALAAVALARLVVVAVQGRRVVRRWPRRVVHGAPVRVSGDVGPAVAGALRPQVVLPAWALDDPRLPVMLAHERAHVRAGDPLLLAAARAAAALLPWHPAVWWQLRRLRAAVEVDCDRRVLRARAADARAYGALLLDVAARPTAALPVLAMASSPTLLRRRIDVITTRRPAHALLRAAVPATLAAALVALACETPRPTGPRPVARVPLTQVVPAADAVPEGHVSAADVRDVLAAHAPDLLQTATGRSRRLWVVQEADGRVSRVEHGLEADLVQPVHELRASRITPGANGTARVTTQGATRELVAVMRPGAIATVEPSRIAAMEVMRLAPGRVTPDGLHVIWLRLRAAGETGATSVLVPSVATAAVPGARGSAEAGRPSSRLTVRDSGRTIGAVPLDAAAPSAGPVALRLSADSASHGPPLYVIDGRIVTRVAGAGAPDDPMATLAPDSIERVGVLKGESARHKYGAAGANGVVEITTKAGAAAAPQAP